VVTAAPPPSAPSPAGRYRRLIVPGVMTVVMLAVLVGLGIWQIRRLAWKEGILAQIEHAEASPAMPMEGATPFGPAIAPETPTTGPAAYSKVSVTGRFREDLSALYGAEVRQTPDGVRMGAQLIVPLERPGKPALLVDRGWVPLTRRKPIGMPAGDVTVAGYVRPGDRPGPFSAHDDVAMRRFYTLDPEAIGAALGLQVEPFTLVALGDAPPDLFPDPARHMPRPPNDHLSYAITWFGLALALAVIFVVWSAKVMRV
jgi:surfeit locus 1 family protein